MTVWCWSRSLASMPVPGRCRLYKLMVTWKREMYTLLKCIYKGVLLLLRPVSAQMVLPINLVDQ